MRKKTFPQLIKFFLFPILLMALITGCGGGGGKSQDYNYKTGTPPR